MIASSLTPEQKLLEPADLVPEGMTFDHYRGLFEERDFWTPIKNSLIVAGTTTIFCVAIGSLCGYALAKLQFTGKTVILAFILAVSMRPQITIVSPLYMLLRTLGLINTYESAKNRGVWPPNVAEPRLAAGILDTSYGTYLRDPHSIHGFGFAAAGAPPAATTASAGASPSAWLET